MMNTEVIGSTQELELLYLSSEGITDKRLPTHQPPCTLLSCETNLYDSMKLAVVIVATASLGRKKKAGNN